MWFKIITRAPILNQNLTDGIRILQSPQFPKNYSFYSSKKSEVFLSQIIQRVDTDSVQVNFKVGVGAGRVTR